MIIRFDPAAFWDGVHVYDESGAWLGHAPVRQKVGFFDMDESRVHARAKSAWVKAERAALEAQRRLSAAEIGRILGLTQPAAWRRIRRLTEAGVVAGRRVVVDKPALGFGVTVFLGIRLAAKGRVSLEDFERAVTAIPEVQVVQHVLGLFDYRLRVAARDLAMEIGVPVARMPGPLCPWPLCFCLAWRQDFQFFLPWRGLGRLASTGSKMM